LELATTAQQSPALIEPATTRSGLCTTTAKLATSPLSLARKQPQPQMIPTTLLLSS